VHADGTVTGPRILDGPIRQDEYAVSGFPVRAILGPDGITTAAWTGTVDGHYAVRAVRITAGVFPQTLSPPGADVQLMDLAGDSAGDAVALWGPTEPVVPLTAAPGVGAAIRTGSFAPFGPPELALPADASAAENPGTAAAAIALGGHVLVAGKPESDPSGPQAVRVTERTG
jgi:hypothetical protein